MMTMPTTETIGTEDTGERCSSMTSSLAHRPMLIERLLTVPTTSRTQMVSPPDGSIASSTNNIVLATTKEQLTNSRLLTLSMLRNYFKLRKPAAASTASVDYYLALLDPSMPKLTNCGRYYRMRYVVYVDVKSRGVMATATARGYETRPTEDNWRCRGRQQQQQLPPQSTNQGAEPLLLQVGELHLYVNCGQEQDCAVERKDAKKITLMYENISFFLNQTPLTADQIERIGLVDSSLDRLVLSFRRILKQLDDDQRVAPGVTGSSLLLEQVKYPKSVTSFRNVDHVVGHFLRNQESMLAKLGGEDEDGLASSLGPKMMLANGTTNNGKQASVPIDASSFVLQMKHFIATSNF